MSIMLNEEIDNPFQNSLNQFIHVQSLLLFDAFSKSRNLSAFSIFAHFLVKWLILVLF